MKILVTEHTRPQPYFEIKVDYGEGYNLNTFAVKTKQEVYAFVSGFNCARQAASALVQCLPDDYSSIKAE